MHKYALEFILHMPDAPVEDLKNAVAEFAEALEIFEYVDNTARGKNFKIHIRTEEPAVIFDICAQFGRLCSVKINEV